MDNLPLLILVAAAVALLVFGVAMAVKGMLNNEKRKLQTRLGGEGRRGASVSQLPLSITRDDDETSGASSYLVRWRPMEGLHRMVIQAYPNMNVTLFVCIVGTCALGMFIILSAATNNL